MVYQEVVDVPTDVRKLFNILLNQALLIFTPFSFSSFSDWSCYLINHVSISEPSNGEYIVKKFIFDLFFFFHSFIFKMMDLCSGDLRKGMDFLRREFTTSSCYDHNFLNFSVAFISAYISWTYFKISFNIKDWHEDKNCSRPSQIQFSVMYVNVLVCYIICLLTYIYIEIFMPVY